MRPHGLSWVWPDLIKLELHFKFCVSDWGPCVIARNSVAAHFIVFQSQTASYQVHFSRILEPFVFVLRRFGSSRLALIAYMYTLLICLKKSVMSRYPWKKCSKLTMARNQPLIRPWVNRVRSKVIIDDHFLAKIQQIANFIHMMISNITTNQSR